MDYSARSELDVIASELQSIINELEDIAWGINNDFKNIGNERCAAAILNVADRYRTVKRKINNI